MLLDLNMEPLSGWDVLDQLQSDPRLCSLPVVICSVQDLGEKAKQAAPESAGDGVAQAQRFAQENPLPVAAAGAFVAGLLLGRILYR